MTREHYDHDAEAGILGGIFRDNRAMARVADLEVEDFHNPRHQAVWMAMKNLDVDGVDAIEPVTVAAELKRMGRAAGLGGDEGCLGYLLELTLRTTIPENVARYGLVLKRHRTSRELLLAASEVLDRLRSEGDDLDGDDAVQWALSRLMGIRSRTKDNGQALGELMLEELASLEGDLAAIERGEVVKIGMPTGITALDGATGGYPIGVVSLVMGATGHGKSTLLSAAARAASAGDDLAFVYSFEDPKKFWAQRALGQESGVPTEAIARRRNLDHALQMRAPGEFAHRRLQRARANAWRRREVIVPASGMTIDDVIADARSRRTRMEAQLGGERRRLIVLIDYVQVVKLTFRRGVEKRTEAIAEVMEKGQWLAQGCGDAASECAVVFSSQVKDEVVKERRAPTIHDWADSYATIKVSKLVLGINRPAKYDREANPLLGSIDVLKRNQGDDEVHANVVLDLAIHEIRDPNDTREEQSPEQRVLGGVQ